MTPAEPAASVTVRLGWLTFELDDLSVWCLGQPFETHLTGQCQTHTAAAQQEANLLAACILQREARVKTLRKHMHISTTVTIKNPDYQYVGHLINHVQT